MEPILKTVASAYSKRYPHLKEMCFVFPNKRCGIFLRKYFDEVDVHTEDLPHILTISEFVSQIARKQEANKIVQLFTLYKAYLDVLNNKKSTDPVVEFDSFRMWGEIVLSDFNTVDLNMADPHEVFKNVKDYREITANFLTQEQKDVMREYFGIDAEEQSGSFWKIFENSEDLSPAKQRFLNLWQILAPLHDKFIEKLEENGEGTAGSIFRKAEELLRVKGKKTIPYKKIVAVGFNALTESERNIFKEIQSFDVEDNYDEFIDFIWDSTGPVLKSSYFTASRFVDYNRKLFPSPEWIEDIIQKEEVKDYPDIRIIAAPSNTTQAKVAGEILKSYICPKGRTLINESEVALVLPDESLLSNVLYSIPEDIGEINLTMGMSLRHSSINGFITLLRRVYVSLREKQSEQLFYRKDIRLFLTHPYSLIIYGKDGIEELLAYMDHYHKVTLKTSEILEFLPQGESFLRFPSKKEKGEEIFLFLEKFFNCLLLDRGASESPTVLSFEEISQIRVYQDYVESLKETMGKFGIKSTPLSILSLINRIIASEKIGFEGEPLIGLQVMGTLETRSLDFKEIIILSMNEGIMPRKAITPTFIPEILRKEYGLPPAKYAEEIFSYYFYRLISRAEKATLIYDGRTISGMRGGESRYLLQLKEYLPKGKVHEETWQYHLNNRPKNEISVEKTNDILDRLNCYTETGETRKNFSASSLNTYRECQVKFFMQNVLNINSEPEKGEFMDPITVGDILHDVMLNIYLTKKDQKQLLNEPKLIQRSFIEDLLENPEHIKELVRKSVMDVYYKENKEGSIDIESGVTDIISAQLEDLVKTIIEYDLTLTPFRLYGCEITNKFRVKLKSGREVNFRFAIDRLDEIDVDGEKRLRIVDYKTGSRKLTAQNLEEVFKGGWKNEQIFQLFTYAWLLGKTGVKGWEDVVTEIYYIPALSKGERSVPKFDKEEVTSFRPYMEEFNTRLDDMIESIFTLPIFESRNQTHDCSFCGFKQFCGQ